MYERHGIPRPVLVPRASVTLMEPRDLEILKETALSPLDFGLQVKALVRKVVSQRGHVGSADIRDELNEHIEALYKRFLVLAGRIDPTAVPAVGKQQRQAMRIVDQTDALLVRRQADQEEILQRRIDYVARGFVPLGGAQERTVGVVHWLARYGRDWPACLGDAVRTVPPGTHAFFAVS